MSDDGNGSSGVTTRVRQIVDDYVDELHAQLSTHDLESVLAGEIDDLKSSDLGSKPETHVQNNLIYPLLEELGLEYTKEPYGGGGGKNDERAIVWPDFELENITADTIGENKALNNVDEAHTQVLDYLDRRSIGADYAIATDGFTWRVYKVEQGGDKAKFPLIREIDLFRLAREIARTKNYISATALTEVEIDEEVEAFVSLFERDNFEEFTSATAPQELRHSRRQDVEEFYQLYVEYVFGESDKYEEPTCLLDDIDAPESATEQEKRRFAVTLMNRLLFVKFLERNEVIPENTLLDRVEAYEENTDAFTGNFYATQIKPLFYDLLNKPRDDRESKHQSGWFGQIPYLNGGLFRANVPNEREYRVEDRTLPDIIREVVEGRRLSDGGTLDPAILGSVFEKTINYIGGETGTQKAVGAYYTPTDVTEHIIEEAVGPAAKDVLVDTYGEEYDDAVRQRMEEYDLAEILKQITEGAGWFGDAKATRKAYDRLGELTILDPACGSGHFLTAVMEEIHRIRRSLLRGLNQGDEPSPEDDYRSKKELALNCIYGVDVDPLAVEIARLRVWLKIVEDDWCEEFGRLPNIELNIVPGNSLIGLPVNQGGQTRGDIWDNRLDDLVTLRREYKSEDAPTTKDDVYTVLTEIRQELDTEYIKRLTDPVQTTVETVDEWLTLLDSVEGDTLHPEIETVKVERADGAELDTSDCDRLEQLGFRTYTYSARLDIEDRHHDLKGGTNRSNADISQTIKTDLQALLDDGYHFVEVTRQPLDCDLDQILGRPFHWAAEFPEVAVDESATHTDHDMEFDIIVGNPPYGDLLDDAEKVVTAHFDTSDINEVAAQFVEREIGLLADGGYFGNVTTLGLVYQSSLENLHNLYDQFGTLRIACFGNCGVFAGVDVRVGLMAGQKKTDEPSTITTSDLIIFTDETRQRAFEDISYGDVSGLFLNGRIGDRPGVMPKVGDATKRQLLTKLRDHSTTTLQDVYDRNDGEYVLYKQRGVRYWMNPMIEKLYDSTYVQPVWYDSQLARDTTFLILNSSLYFLYWHTYGSQLAHEWLHMKAFPYPDEDRVEEHADRIHALTTELWEEMKTVFSESDGFTTGKLRSTIDDVDELIADLYGLTDEETTYIKTYLTDLGGNTGRSKV